MVALVAEPSPPATFHHSEFHPRELALLKRSTGTRVHVVIPARDEAATVGQVAGVVRRELMDRLELVDDLLVVDDRSRDATSEEALSAGARVVEGPGAGKGEAMARGLEELRPTLEARPEVIVVFLDGDVIHFGPRFVSGLVGPLLAYPSVDLVKATYRRPLGEDPEGGGRVTELLCRPALARFFPELSHIRQPLAGETAVRASLLSELELAGGYAVEIAMLLDAAELRGPGSVAQVDMDERRHRNRRLAELVPQASAVLAEITSRREAAGCLAPRRGRSAEVAG